MTDTARARKLADRILDEILSLRRPKQMVMELEDMSGIEEIVGRRRPIIVE